ncbi:amidohydrolase [Novosphingobium sp. G106]|uniref:amidohydrolase family protein n=1 Tax=Novosphingobium sp. G106 TaxID=2849500 RepID=UPI001C2D39DF|nr:amidohydrolase family protein [Novosphingobium sp. G106]MBV1686791.1 amidohydrolase [Novosphingobium sp. G106]
MGFEIFDADQHYYEAEDCFTRFASLRMRSEKFIRWVTEADGKRRRLFVGGRDANVIGNPTFDPCAQPGVYHETLKLIETGQDRSAAAYGQLEPIRPAYRDRQVRLGVMDEQGVDRTLLFPTLGVTMEGFMKDDVGLLYDAFEAFNRWLDEDWGFDFKGRIYAAPYLIMLDRDRLIAELERVLEAGAKLITIRPGPAYGRSPADPYFDPFWARVEEAGVLVTYHAYEGPSEQVDAFYNLWAAPPHPRGPEHRLLAHVMASVDSAAMDTLTALVLHNLFGRFPRLKVATIEMGCGWVPYLMKRLDHAGGLVNRKITSFGGTLDGKPSEIFKRHVWVAPFPEEDVVGLARTIGADHVLMGSDWPHAEAIPRPREYVECLDGLEDGEKQAIMRDNIAGLIAA